MLQTLKLPLQKGLILYNPKVKLDDGSIKNKFFVLMENYNKKLKSLIIFMLSSDGGSRRKSILIQEPFLENNTAYVIFKKWLDISVFILNKDYQKKGMLSDAEINKIDCAIKKTEILPTKIRNRILNEKEISKVKPNTFKLSEIAKVRRLTNRGK